MKIQLTIKLEEKKGNFIQAKLRVITQEEHSQKALRTVLLVWSQRHRGCTFSRQRVIHQSDILTFYVQFPKDTGTYKANSWSRWPPVEWGKNAVLLRSYIASVEGRGKNWSVLVEHTLPSLRRCGQCAMQRSAAHVRGREGVEGNAQSFMVNFYCLALKYKLYFITGNVLKKTYVLGVPCWPKS